MTSTEVVKDTAASALPTYLPDYRGQPLDIAFTDVVRQHRGLPVLVDGDGKRVRVTTLADWKVVQQHRSAHSVVFVIKKNC